MDKVFIVYEVDQNDETTIYKVFSDYDKAISFKNELLVSFPYAHIYCDEWVVTK